MEKKAICLFFLFVVYKSHTSLGILSFYKKKNMYEILYELPNMYK